MFNHFNRAQKIESFLRHLGVSFDGLPAHIDDDDAQIITFFLTIDNHLKLKKIMETVQDVLNDQQSENTVIAQLASAVTALVQLDKDQQAKIDALIAQASNGPAISADQLQALKTNAATGTQTAKDALATALAALTPATPAADPNATTSGTAAGSTGSDSGQGSTDGSTPPADGSTPPTATDAVNG